MRFFKHLAVLFCTAVLLVGCKPPSPSETLPDPILTLMVGNPGGDDGGGSATMAGYRNGTLTLTVIAAWALPEGHELSEYETGKIGPAKGQAITWTVVGGADRFITLADKNGVTQTDDDGITSMNVTVSSDAKAATYQVRAYVNEDVALSFTIRVKELEKHLEIDGKNSRSMGLAHSDLIRAYVRNQSNGPVEGAEVKFDIVDGQAKFNDSKMGFRADPLNLDSEDDDNSVILNESVKLSYTATTNSQGIADVYFFTGVSGGEYKIVASTTGVEQKDNHIVNYSIKEMTGGCTNNDDCSYSQICINGSCGEPPVYCDPHTHPDGDVRCSPNTSCSEDKTCKQVTCSNDDACNYTNGVEQCDPVNENECTAGSYCDETTRTCVGQVCYTDKTDNSYCIYHHPCENNKQCYAGWQCDTDKHYCIPWALDIEPLKVGGTWYTSYRFDLSEILGFFGVNGFIGKIITFLQLLTGTGLANAIDIPILGDVLQTIVQQIVKSYVPAWVVNLINVLSDFISTFEMMDATGAMLLSQPIVHNDLNGKKVDQLGTYIFATESWDSLTIYMPSMAACKSGRSSTNWPECGAIDVAANSVIKTEWSDSNMRVGVYMSAFNGQYVYGQDSSGNFVNEGASVQFKDREIEMQIRSLIVNMLDLVAQTATNGQYSSLQDVLCKTTITDPNAADKNAASTSLCGSDSLGGLTCSLIAKGIKTLAGKMFPEAAASVSDKTWGTVESICSVAAMTAAASFNEWLNKMETEIDIQEMAQSAYLEVDPNKSSRAGSMGMPQNGSDNMSGTFSGKTIGKLDRPIEGTWGGNRDKAALDAARK